MYGELVKYKIHLPVTKWLVDLGVHMDDLDHG